MGDRAVLHLPGGPDDPNLPDLLTYCQTRGYHIVGTAPDLPAAYTMVNGGGADVVVVASRTVLDRLEIVTMEITPVTPPGQPGHRTRRVHRR